MPWITKNSAAIKIDRRAGGEPYLTPAMRQELSEKVLPRYERKQGALLPALHMVQHAYGWIPHQAMVEIAEFFTQNGQPLKPADVIDCASFYEEYWLKPKGKHLVAVCRSIACEFAGGGGQPAVTDACKQKLGIEVGETTDDGTYTLIEIECLGSCGTAPAILVDETLHENVTPQQVPAILDAAPTAAHHDGRT